MPGTRRIRIDYYRAAERVKDEAAGLLRWLAKYSPDQPRAPSGQSDGGQFIPWVRTAGPFDGEGREACDLQYDRDMFQCTFVASGRSRWACKEQAMVRYVACLKDQTIPPHIYYLGDAS